MLHKRASVLVRNSQSGREQKDVATSLKGQHGLLELNVHHKCRAQPFHVHECEEYWRLFLSCHVLLRPDFMASAEACTLLAEQVTTFLTQLGFRAPFDLAGLTIHEIQEVLRPHGAADATVLEPLRQQGLRCAFNRDSDGVPLSRMLPSTPMVQGNLSSSCRAGGVPCLAPTQPCDATIALFLTGFTAWPRSGWMQGFFPALVSGQRASISSARHVSPCRLFGQSF